MILIVVLVNVLLYKANKLISYLTNYFHCLKKKIHGDDLTPLITINLDMRLFKFIILGGVKSPTRFF